MSRAPGLLKWLPAAVGAFAMYGALQGSSASGAETLPAWLTPAHDTKARVDVAPWVTSDEPEAALTQSIASAARDYGADAGRPADIVYQPIGVRVRIVRVLVGRSIALVRGIDVPWQAYAPLDRLVPEVPRGTKLTVAGGFGGSADFYAQLAPDGKSPLQVLTGTHVSALQTGVAPFDPGNSDLVRIHVHVLSGSLRGDTGWIAVAYTGLPLKRVARSAGITAKACSCRLVHFKSGVP